MSVVPEEIASTRPLVRATSGALRPTGVSGYAARLFRDQMRERLSGLQGGALRILDSWGGFHIGEKGAAPGATLHIHDPRFYIAVALGGSLGAARAYRDGLWDSDDLTGVFRLLVRNADLIDSMDSGLARVAAAVDRVWHKARANTRSGSADNIEAHYDLGNDFFALWLDPTMTYSAGIFEGPHEDMELASIAKLDRICTKLRLGPRDHVVEIGTGWGSFAIHAAGSYGCRVTTTTISREQKALAEARIAAAGLSDRVTVLLRDYRDMEGEFDALVSIEMIEAVGHEFLPGYFQSLSRLLKPTGRACIQAITMPDSRYPQYLKATDFIQRFIFPGSCVPSFGAIQSAVGRCDLKTVHVEDIGPHYATTLRLWREQFNRVRGQVREMGYDAGFVRLWDYYLSYCEAGFEERYLGDLQLVLHKPGRREAPLLGDL
ncbi:MAG: class I SAM-dependent methyltransferase [Gammaproteobacteria bacterium]